MHVTSCFPFLPLRMTEQASEGIVPHGIICSVLAQKLWGLKGPEIKSRLFHRPVEAH